MDELKPNECTIQGICSRDIDMCVYASIINNGSLSYCKYQDEQNGYCNSAVAIQNSMFYKYKDIGINIEFKNKKKVNCSEKKLLKDMKETSIYLYDYTPQEIRGKISEWSEIIENISNYTKKEYK